jgi:hypothetical protein
VTNEQYDKIMAKLKEAKAEGNKRKMSIWRKKLEQWQLDYGAYAPIRR